MTRTIYLLIPLLLLLAVGCQSDTEEPDTPKDPTPSAPTVEVNPPAFSADSAYAYIEKQVDFGPRVPGTQEHKACGDWLVAMGERFAGEGSVIEQEGRGRLYTGKVIDFRNIIIQFNKPATQRIALFAHWDTRLFGDHDPDPTKRNEPILGANDGGSGVGVLLEIARLLKNNPVEGLGIDIIFFDAEDQGAPEDYTNAQNAAASWCLGSQYWSRNIHRGDARYRWGILLDMVGAGDAQFPKEGHSLTYASRLVDRVWDQAGRLGYGKYFIGKKVPGLIDDHYFVNQIANIPTIDIIHYGNGPKGFGSTWHTHDDNMEVISRETLKAVGETVSYVVYEEVEKMEGNP